MFQFPVENNRISNVGHILSGHISYFRTGVTIKSEFELKMSAIKRNYYRSTESFRHILICKGQITEFYTVFTGLVPRPTYITGFPLNIT